MKDCRLAPVADSSAVSQHPMQRGGCPIDLSGKW